MRRLLPPLFALTAVLAVALPNAAGAVGADGTVRSAATAPDTTPPVITRLKLSHVRFRIGNDTTAQIAAKQMPPTGTTFRLVVSERSTVLIAIAGKVAGHTSGARCVPGPGRGARCVTIVTPGPIIRSGRGPGSVTIPFSGRLGATRLQPGRYAAAVAAVDDAGHRSAIKLVKFTIVGP
jgi:hypothetical protein